MTDRQYRSRRGAFLPVQENLQRQARYAVEGARRYQLAPRNQVETRSAYMPDITCSIDQLDFDACVSAAPGQSPRYHFSVAVPLALCYVSLALTATEEFISEVPLDPSLTVREDPNDTRFHSFVDYRYLRGFEGGVRILRRTDDSRRYPIGDSLAALALQFIALHEEGHYLNGHLDASLGFRKAGRYSETRNISPGASLDDLLTSRALELDADHFAAMAMLTPLASKSATEYISGTVCELGRTPLGFMRFAASAGSILGMILWQAEGGTAGPSVERRTHPSPHCRIVHFAHLVSTIVDVFLARADDEWRAWDETVNRDTTTILNLFGLKGVFDFRRDADTPWRNEWCETRQRLIQLKPTMSEAAARARRTVGIGAHTIFPWEEVDLLTWP